MMTTQQMPARMIDARIREMNGHQGSVLAAWEALSDAERAEAIAYHDSLERLATGRDYHHHAPDMAGWVQHLLFVLGDRLRLNAPEFNVIRETMRIKPRKNWHRRDALTGQMAPQCGPGECICRRIFTRQPRWTIWPGDPITPCVPRYVVLTRPPSVTLTERGQWCEDVELWCRQNLTDLYHIDWSMRFNDKALLYIRDDVDMALARLTYE